MNIGILTYHRAVNYGAFLQSYSLCRALNQQSGIKAEVIDYSMQSAWNYYDVSKWNLKKKLKSFGQLSFKKKQLATFNEAVERNRGVFSKDMLISDDTEEFRKLFGSRYDAIIVGSDEVWKVNHVRSFPNPYFLPGDMGCRKFSYAASFGKSVNVAGENEKKMQSFLNDFEAISVRDRIGYDYLCGNKIGKQVMISCDPSFLYDFKEEIQNSRNPLKDGSVRIDPSKKTVAVMLDESSADVIREQLKGKYNLVSLFREQKGFISMVDVDPFCWLKIISEADFVISCFFHGVCFGICNDTPVLAVGAKGKKHKLEDLLQGTELWNCYVPGEQLAGMDLQAKIEEISLDVSGYQKFVQGKRSSFEEYVKLLRKDTSQNQ